MAIRGVRGAVTVGENEPEAIRQATRELLEAMLSANPTLQPGDVASALFTATADLDTAYPARAARDIGWGHVPLMCAQEIAVADGLPRCIRIMLHWNTDLLQHEISHVYLGDAASLRPDLAGDPTELFD